MTFASLGDSALVITISDDPSDLAIAQAHAVANSLGQDPPAGTRDVVAAFASVTIFYDPVRIDSFDVFRREVEERIVDARPQRTSGRSVDIPVCYGGTFGPDIDDVAIRAGLSVERVIELHSGTEYVVHAIGFAPGFAYLGGLPTKLHTPRLATPRTQVSAGSVGIGGAQTGVYPFESPGGWNIVGRTPLKMFDPCRQEPAVLKPGDRVQFRAISEEEFASWK